MEKRRPGEIPSLDNRKESYELIDRQKRYLQIIECLLEVPRMSAKEVASLMCLKGYIPTSERNFTQPRLNELCERGVVEQVGKKKCSSTGRTVTVYELTEKWSLPK